MLCYSKSFYKVLQIMIPYHKHVQLWLCLGIRITRSATFLIIIHLLILGESSHEFKFVVNC